MPISKPNISVSKLSALAEQGNTAQKILVIGGMTSAGTATSGALKAAITEPGQAETFFGIRSQAADMIREILKLNKKTRIDAIGLSDVVTDAFAAGVVTFTGTVTVAGVITVVVGSSVNRKYAISVTVGMTAAQCATALAALLAADTRAPFTGSATDGAVTITMANKGIEGNATVLKVYDDTVQRGLAWALTAFASGTGQPVMTSVLDVVGDARYQTIVAPYGFGTAYLITFLDARWNVNNAIRDGVAVLCKTDTYANLITLGGTLNSKGLVVFGDKALTDADHKSSANAEQDYIKAAQFGAIRALRLTEDADISQFVTSSTGALDAFGGAAIASLPYFNTPMINLPLFEDNYAGFTGAQADALRDVGISCFGNNVAATAVICGEVVTTYKTDSSGAVDTTWKYLETVDTASAAGEFIFNNLKADYSQCRLTTGDLIPGRAMANAESITAGFLGYCGTLAGPDYVLVQAGEDALNYIKRNLVIAITMAEGKVTLTGHLPLVTQVRSMIVPLKMVLTSVSA